MQGNTQATAIFILINFRIIAREHTHRIIETNAYIGKTNRIPIQQYIYIYRYNERERKRERDKERKRQRDKERKRQREKARERERETVNPKP